MKTSNIIEQDREIVWLRNEKRMLKYMLERDGMQFMRYFFYIRERTKMVCNWHHYVIDYVLQAVIDGLIPRLIINLAPGYTKSQQAVVGFIARTLAINPRSKYIHTSSSDDLALENSTFIKDIVQSEEYQELWPMTIRVDKKGKKRWYTEEGGGMMAAASGGQITGFRAGRMEKGHYTGSLINDDPIKPEDIFSKAKLNRVNSRSTNTLRSRLALESVPIIHIMQRLADGDPTAHLLRGPGDIWHHLNMPTYLTEESMNSPYPEDYTNGIPININGILNAIHGGEPYDFQSICIT